MTVQKFSLNFNKIPFLNSQILTQPPQKPDEMEAEFDASLEGDDCIQMSRSKLGTSGSEDCLYINVYVPKVSNQNSA